MVIRRAYETYSPPLLPIQGNLAQVLKCSSDQEMLTEQLKRDCRGCYNEATITEERIGQLEAENATLQEQLALER
jgi:hypothetical protein